MQFVTKFDIGQKVWTTQKTALPYDVDCPLCEGRGRIQIKTESRLCPDCKGRGKMKKTPPPAWTPKGPMTVGMVRVQYAHSPGVPGEEIFDNYKAYGPSREEEYMCVETGIRTGSIWRVERLFGTESLAQAECDKKNTEHLQRVEKK